MGVDEARLHRERQHAARILADDESNWGWSTPSGRIRRARREAFLVEAGSPDLAVLEVGCGSGTFTGALARAFPKIVAIDIAPAMIEAARARFPGVDFRVMDAHRLEFPEGAFDLVLGCSTLHHLDWAAALREAHRVLKPGGRVRFSEPNLSNPQIFLQKSWPWLKRRMGDSPDEYAFTRRQILRDLRDAGFVDATVEPYEFLHPAVPEGAIGLAIRIERALERTPIRAIGGSLRITAQRG